MGSQNAALRLRRVQLQGWQDPQASRSACLALQYDGSNANQGEPSTFHISERQESPLTDHTLLIVAQNWAAIECRAVKMISKVGYLIIAGKWYNADDPQRLADAKIFVPQMRAVAQDLKSIFRGQRRFSTSYVKDTRLTQHWVHADRYCYGRPHRLWPGIHDCIRTMHKNADSIPGLLVRAAKEKKLNAVIRAAMRQGWIELDEIMKSYMKI